MSTIETNGWCGRGSRRGNPRTDGLGVSMSDFDTGFDADPARVAERRREQVERLVSRINGLLRDVTEILMRSASREPTERALCERIVETGPYDTAWIGEVDVASDAIVPSTSAGPDVPGKEFAIDRRSSHPVAEALETDSVRVSTDDSGTGPAGIAAAPLSYGDRSYGVLVVGVDDAAALDEIEVTVVEALGWTISIAIDAARSRRILATDDIVEVAFEVRDSALVPIALSQACDCQFSYEGTVFDADGSTIAFFSTDVDHDTVRAAVAEEPRIEANVVAGDKSGGLIEFDLGHDSFVRLLAERGATIQRLDVDEGTARLELEVPSAADPRSIVDWVQEAYPATELVAFRDRQRPPTTKREFLAELESDLTNRQLMALELAYLSGFYDRTRTVTGKELAERMDISRPAFHDHLRAAERKVIGQFLEESRIGFGRDG